MYLLEMFGVSLLLTLVLELTVAGAFRIPFGRDWLPVILVNVLTNPVAVWLCFLSKLYLSKGAARWTEYLLEIIIVIVEYLIYRSLAKSGWSCRRPFLLSLMANGVSWLTGIVSGQFF